MWSPTGIPSLRQLVHSSVLTGAIALAFLAIPRTGYSLFIREGAWAPNGPVNAIVSSGNALYFGGNFSLVGPVSGPAVAIDYNSALAQKPYPRVTGRVRAVEPDGDGGWYIGGYFTAVQGQSRNNLAHIDAAGNVTPWDPDVNDEVLDIAVGSGVVYVGGSFTYVGAMTRPYAAAIGMTDGIATSWVCLPSGPVTEVELGGSVVYIGGDFTVVSNEPREHRAALEVTTGDLTALFAGTGSGVTYTEALEFSAGKLFIATTETNGSFLRVYDEATAGFLPYSVPSDGFIHDVAFDPTLGWAYLGGTFLTMGGQGHLHLAAIDVATGSPVTSWNHSTAGTVRTVSILHTVSPEGDPIDGVVIGGLFDAVGGQPRKNMAALHATQPTVFEWSPGCGGEVFAVEADGGEIYAGGDFSIINGVSRSNLAAIEATAGSLLDWAPTTNATVDALLASGSTIYLGGNFSLVNGTNRNLAAAVDAFTGVLTAFNPNVGSGFTRVKSFAISGSTMYMGGGFGTVGGEQQVGIAAVNATTGGLLPWDPGSNGAVRAISYVPGGIFGGPILVVGGDFTVIGGQACNYLAILDPGTGAAATLHNPNGPVHSLVVEPLPPGYGGFNVAYIGGAFTSVGGEVRNHIAKVAPLAVSAWDPNVNGVVYSMVKVGNTVLVGGDFSLFGGHLGGQQRSNIASIDSENGLATDWDPHAFKVSGGASPVYALLKQGTTVYAGGEFTMIAETPQSYFAGITDETITAVKSESVPGVAPSAVRIAPNPFDRSTKIQFSLASEGETRVTIFDVAGRRVREIHDGWLSSGRHVMPWDGRDDLGRPVAAGIYLLGVKTQAGTLGSKIYRLK